ncbi:hypothetical protein [Bythopirellula goksoeyrii]|uniref:PEP-CTERM protein-sorting domain-containing protein n=1 Tax=Bythopirellula goksoeyrii TaxID=1400387 RepID=A0A5B9QEJ4_9BACT|nr:hypothetical protein [Bythopirellula goksoeyrii]QEG36015.1 hypothetical protein Pr1d_33240 [Bythopirellula goksoeyrii]
MRILLASLLVCSAAQVASASIQLDFGKFAASELPAGPLNTPQGERGYGFGAPITINGVGLDLYAWNTTNATTGPPLTSQVLSTSVDTANFTRGGTPTQGGSNNAGPYAYLDGRSSGRLGGLGASQELTGSFQADPSSDDNVSGVGSITNGREVVGMIFASSATIDVLSFRDLDHYADRFTSTNLIDVTFDSGNTWETISPSSVDGTYDFGGRLVSQGDIFGLAFNNTQFYLTSAAINVVPEPLAVFTWFGLASIGGIMIKRFKQG